MDGVAMDGLAMDGLAMDRDVIAERAPTGVLRVGASVALVNEGGCDALAGRRPRRLQDLASTPGARLLKASFMTVQQDRAAGGRDAAVSRTG